MKRFVSIMLLGTFLFNLGGCYALFWVMKKRANIELSTRLDEGQYAENEVLEIKIPMTLPYPIHSNGFERKTGQFTYNKEHYQLVKQKYENDTLTIVCIKDRKASSLARTFDKFTESAGHSSKKDNAPNIPIKVLQDYIHNTSDQTEPVGGWVRVITQNGYSPFFELVSLKQTTPPPRS